MNSSSFSDFERNQINDELDKIDFGFHRDDNPAHIKTKEFTFFQDGFDYTCIKKIKTNYFGNFDVERMCIDRVIFTVYDKKYSIEKHEFDTELRDRYHQFIKSSAIAGKKEQVLNKREAYSWWELRLKGSRTMYAYCNIIKILQEKYDMYPEPCEILHEDNFLPVHCGLKFKEFVLALRQHIKKLEILYHDMVLQFWGYDCKDIVVKISLMEIPYEVFPASVAEIAKTLNTKGLKIQKYNTQSSTLYITSPLDDAEKLTVPDKKFEHTYAVPVGDLQPDIVYVNKINSGHKENKVQLKIYQKTFGLVRIEWTIFANDIKDLFIWDKKDEEIAQDVKDYVYHMLHLYSMPIKRFDRNLEAVVRWLSRFGDISEDIIYSLRGIDVFETTRDNEMTVRKLVRKGVIEKMYDDTGRPVRGQYLVSPVFSELLNRFKPCGNEHFLKGVEDIRLPEEAAPTS